MKKCPTCGEEVIGRSDKVYCSKKCASTSHYEHHVANDQFFIHVDKQLKVNRKILKKYNRSGFTTLRKEQLVKEGFDPNFFTHYWKNKKGQVYLFCYDYGFLEVDQKGLKKYLLVEWQEYMKKKPFTMNERL
jgi:hypothetical protein